MRQVQTFAAEFTGRLRHAFVTRAYECFNELRSALHPRSGVTKTRREQELIVSLTTIPERIGKVHLCIETLLRQSVQPDRVILWLSESNEPGRPLVTDDALPSKLRRLQERGLEIRWCKDIRSYRKIIPTLRIFPEAIVVTSDDDVYYPRRWLEQLYGAYLKEPRLLHCHRAHLVKYDAEGRALPYLQWDLTAPGMVGPSTDLFPTGVGGVLYAPGHLHPEVLNEEVFLAICPTADDVWLKAMSLLNGVACRKVKPGAIAFVEIRIPHNPALSQHNVNANGNDVQIAHVADRYRVFMRAPVPPTRQPGSQPVARAAAGLC
jgi:hypothetical protein